MLSIGQAVRQDWISEDGTPYTDYGVVVGIIFEWSRDYFASGSAGPWYGVRWDVIATNPGLAPHYNFVSGEDISPVRHQLVTSDHG